MIELEAILYCQHTHSLLVVLTRLMWFRKSQLLKWEERHYHRTFSEQDSLATGTAEKDSIFSLFCCHTLQLCI